MAIKKRNPRSRLILAITLICASFLSALIFAALSNKKEEVWVARNFLPAGHRIEQIDLARTSVNLGERKDKYLASDISLIGSLLSHGFEEGELLTRSGVDSQGLVQVASSVPIKARAADVPVGVAMGDEVDIYWLTDSQNGESYTDPVLVITDAVILDMSKSGQNFGNEVSMTVSIPPGDVMVLLTATTQGRLVLVSAHG
jgi:hypothetical protein